MDAPPGLSANVPIAQRGLQALILAYTEQRCGPNTILSRVSAPVCAPASFAPHVVATCEGLHVRSS